jgi:hypothetical protein
MRAFVVLLGLMAGSALAQEPSSPESDVSRRELGLQVGYALKYDDGENYGMGGMGLRLQWLERLGSYIALGLEAALYKHAGSSLYVNSDDHHFIITYRPLFQLGGVGRIGVDLGRVRPSLLVGLGWYKARSHQLGYSGGTEVAVRIMDKALLVLDARLHNDGDDHAHYRTLGLGLRLVW